MGDGYIDKEGDQNPRLRCTMITKEYLEYLDDVFGILSTGVKLHQTAKELVKENIERGFNTKAKIENYHDLYRWQTISMSQLDIISEWYDSGEKVWPKDIDLTSTVLKHWYVGDGCYINKNSKDYIKIALANEVDNKEKVYNYFKEVGLPEPDNWDISERNDGGMNCSVEWNKDKSKELLEYMLEDGYGIPPGFEYKWPEEFH
jgi:hypothetical protein